jgi:hypothetical protein
MRNLVWVILFVLAFGFVAGWVVAESFLALRRATAAVNPVVPDQATGSVRPSPRLR